MSRMSKTPDLERLLDAALAHVPFDGWSDTTFREAARDLDLSPEAARALAPRGALDLACAYHRRGDSAMIQAMEAADLSEMRYSEKVAQALKFRIAAIPDREAVRRATTLFSLPHNAPEGAKLVWETADAVWRALGDTSTDGSWYSKRATLSAVWGSVVLYWLGDDSEDDARTFDFIDRRIDNVMSLEKLKGQMRSNPLTRPLMNIEAALMGKMRAPGGQDTSDLPGRW
ncbi:MAG: COQ9 family protein [Silicimonas sp.]|nr:COQ9 family protein [Silicimonas sp.]